MARLHEHHGKAPLRERGIDVPAAMRDRPTLTTRRLVLRPFAPEDAARIRSLAGDEAVADTTLNIPHPYEAHHADEWMADHAAAFAAGERLDLAIDAGGADGLIGSVSLRIDARHERADMGYWVGRPYWGQGHATEAAAAMLTCGFRTLGLHRITAHHLTRNPASGRVLEKIGMSREGVLRHHVLHRGRYEDIAFYGILRPEHEPTP